MVLLLYSLVWNSLEATVLAAVVYGLCRTTRISPPLRHALWLLVLLKLLMPPVAGHSLGLSALRVRGVAQLRDQSGWNVSWAYPEASGVSTTREAITAVEPMATPESLDDSPPADGPTVDATSEFTARIAEELPVDELPASSANPNPLTPTVKSASAIGVEWGELIIGLALTGWCAGATVLACRRIRQILTVRVLLDRTVPASAALTAMSKRMARRMSISNPPPLRVTALSVSPMVAVGRRPVIVLPEWLIADSASKGAIDSVVAHELAHLKRRDHWVCWLELLASIAYWWLPSFWFLRHRLREAADEAADLWAVSAIGCRRRYAEALLKTTEFLIAERTAVPVLGPALGERETIARRLTMIMKEPLAHRLSWPAWVAVAIVGGLVLPSARYATSAQEAAKPSTASVPTDDEIATALDALDSALAQREREERQPPPRDRRPDAPRPPDAPRDSARPPQPPGRRDAPPMRETEQRLQELESKLDRLMNMLESRREAAPPMPMGGFATSGGRGGFGDGPPGPFGRTPPMAGGRFARGPENMDEMLRGIDLGPDQRERLEHAQRDVHAELQRIETEQARVIEEFQRRRLELERRRLDIVREILSPEQRERLEQRRRERGHGHEAGHDDERGGGPERHREGAEPRREGSPERPGDGARGRGEPGRERPRESAEPRRDSDRERPRESGAPDRRRDDDRDRDDSTPSL